MESRLQRDPTPQQLRTNAASKVRRVASPVNWQSNATEQDRYRDQLTLQTPDFRNLDWYGKRGQVRVARKSTRRPRSKKDCRRHAPCPTSNVHTYASCDRCTFASLRFRFEPADGTGQSLDTWSRSRQRGLHPRRHTRRVQSAGLRRPRRGTGKFEV